MLYDHIYDLLKKALEVVVFRFSTKKRIYLTSLTFFRAHTKAQCIIKTQKYGNLLFLCFWVPVQKENEVLSNLGYFSWLSYLTSYYFTSYLKIYYVTMCNRIVYNTK
jgi:hypothetical protein